MSKTRLARSIIAALATLPAWATELKPETASAFDRYVHAVETRMQDEIARDQFLAVDRLPDSRRRAAYDQLQHGHLYMEALHARENGSPVRVPGGLVNHWVGVIFIRGAKLSQVVSVLQDYDDHSSIYKPQIRRSKLIAREGDESRVYLQLYSKSIVTVILNADFDVTDEQSGQFTAPRHEIAMRSRRIVEVVNPDVPDEHEMPVGNDHGYLWRFNAYWRIEEKDGGVYVQNESIALSRSIPLLFTWLFNSLTSGIPRDILSHLLTGTQNAVMKSQPLTPC
jgi:hypothetical protein